MRVCRKKILALISERNGISSDELVAKVRASKTNIRVHLKTLTDSGEISRYKYNQTWYYLSTSENPAKELPTKFVPKGYYVPPVSSPIREGAEDFLKVDSRIGGDFVPHSYPKGMMTRNIQVTERIK